MASDDYRWNFDYNRVARDSGFAFQTHRSKPSLDHNIDIEQIIRDRDTATIERYIPTVCEFALDNDQTSILDPTFVRVFRMSQLAVQYLLFCKKYLDNTVVLLKQEFIRNNEETKNLKRTMKDLRQELTNYHKQINDLKAALNLQTMQNSQVYQCNECPKAFSTEEYLLAHIKRRHEFISGTASTSFQAETDKLQLEIKQLKERLNNTEKYIHSSDESEKPRSDFIVMPNFPVKDSKKENTALADLQQKFELLKVHVENELRILQTQKFDQEKYEKWFETFLNKLEQTHGKTGTGDSLGANEGENVCKNCQTKEPTQSLVHKSDSMTQTELGTTPVCKECQAKPAHTEHLEKFEEMLQEKVTGSMEMIENQMQTFWHKMNEMEKQKENTESPLIKEPRSNQIISVTPQKVVPKPRKKIHLVKETFSFSPTGSPAISPQQKTFKKAIASPKEIIKSSPIIQKVTASPKESIKASPNVRKVQKPIRTSPKSKSFQKPSITSVRSPPNAVSLRQVGTNAHSASETDSESSEESASSESSDSEPNTKVIIKPSMTSTLGRRSMTSSYSLKEAALTDKVLEGLQKEVENILNNRLEESGVSPNWSTLPLRSYERVMGIINQQTEVLQKTIPNYKQIQAQIFRRVDQQVKARKRNVQQKESKLKNLLNSVRSRSKAVLHEPLRQPKIEKAESLQSVSDAKLTPRMYATDSESDNNTKNKKPSAWNQSKIADQTQRAYHDVIQEYMNTKMKQHDSASDNSCEIPVKEPKPEAKDESEDESHSDVKIETQAKSVLKTGSTGSLQKKKVNFDLESVESSVLDQNKQVENIQVPVKLNDGGSTTSVASSIFDGPKPSVNPAETEKKQQDLSDVSDWDISDL